MMCEGRTMGTEEQKAGENISIILVCSANNINHMRENLLRQIVMMSSIPYKEVIY